MPKVKFKRDRRGDSSLAPVYFTLCHNYERRSNYEIIGLSVAGSMWNEKAKGSPESVKGTSDEAIKLRDKLKTIKHQLEVEIPDFLFKEHELPKKTQTIDDIFNELLRRYGHQIKEERKPKRLISEYVKEFMEVHSTYDATTIGKYKRLKETMEDFAAANNESLLLKQITYPWLSKYCAYLTTAKRKDGKIGYENDYIQTLFSKLNSVMNYYDLAPFKLKKIVGHLRKFKGKETDVKEIDLATALKIYHFDCVMNGSINRKWLKVRDAYVWTVFSGQRHNELYALTKKSSLDTRINVEGNRYTVLKYVSDKTGQPNEIALNDICMEIIDRWKDVDLSVTRSFRSGQKITYNEPLVPVMSSYRCNQYLSEMLEEIAFRDSVRVYGPLFTRENQEEFEPISFYRKKLRVRYVGTVRKEEVSPEWKYLTFKTSRTSTANILTDNGASDAEVASQLNNDEETVRKHYKRKKRSTANLKTKELMDQAIKKAAM